MRKENDAIRQTYLKNIKRAVIKIGSGVLTAEHGLDLSVVDNIVSQISDIKKRGIDVVVVSSGAIAAGLPRMGLTERPTSLAYLQAAASVGQTSLMRAYERSFERFSLVVGQMLLTHEDLRSRHRFITARNTILALLSLNIVPIINENDTVAVAEIRLGDNDNLAAQTINLCGADILIILTDIDGFYDKDPRLFPDARLIPLIKNIKRETRELAKDTSSSVGKGGMKSKIQAAEMAAVMGIPTIIVGGRIPDAISKILDGHSLGTLFLPKEEGITSRKHWIAYTLKAKGSVTVDTGAVIALSKSGKSLLPKGILDVSGDFHIGDLISVVGPDRSEFARGLVNYNAKEVERIKGHNTKEIEEVLGFKYTDEVIHRDNLVLFG
jgi:glutamate 5-kinase